MPQYTSKRRVRHSASNMFDLVADMQKYPEFVPLCTDLRIRSRTEKAPDVSVVVASMTVA